MTACEAFAFPFPPSPVPPIAPPDFIFAPGKTWFGTVTLYQRNADGSKGPPDNLTGGTPSAIMFVNGGPLTGIPLTVDNGGISVPDPTNGQVNFVLDENQSRVAVPDIIPPFVDHYVYRNRIEVDFRDTRGHLTLAGLASIRVIDPRTEDSSSFPLVQSSTLVGVALQGLPGPASYKTYRILVTSVGQRLLAWPNGTPPDLTDVGLLVDGREYRAPFITTAATGITWAGPFDLEPTDDVLARY